MIAFIVGFIVMWIIQTIEDAKRKWIDLELELCNFIFIKAQLILILGNCLFWFKQMYLYYGNVMQNVELTTHAPVWAPAGDLYLWPDDGALAHKGKTLSFSNLSTDCQNGGGDRALAWFNPWGGRKTLKAEDKNIEDDRNSQLEKIF